MDDERDNSVTDSDIEAIMEQGEAGIGDLMAAYEPIENEYFTAVQVASPTSTVTYSINTAPSE